MCNSRRISSNRNANDKFTVLRTSSRLHGERLPRESYVTSLPKGTDFPVIIDSRFLYDGTWPFSCNFPWLAAAFAYVLDGPTIAYDRLINAPRHVALFGFRLTRINTFLPIIRNERGKCRPRVLTHSTTVSPPGEREHRPPLLCTLNNHVA